MRPSLCRSPNAAPRCAAFQLKIRYGEAADIRKFPVRDFERRRIGLLVMPHRFQRADIVQNVGAGHQKIFQLSLSKSNMPLLQPDMSLVLPRPLATVMSARKSPDYPY